jgi:hypothetical protein
VKRWYPEYQTRNFTQKSPASQTTLKVSFLEQSFVLMRHDVGLNLRHEIHRYNHNDKQGSATKIERNIPLQNQKFGQQANQRNVDRSNQREPSQDLVDVARSLVSRTNAWNKSTTLLQVVSRFLGVEYQGGVKETEENNR